MSRIGVASALLLALLMIAPILAAGFTMVASAVSPGAQIYIEPRGKVLVVDPMQDFVVTVQSSANAFGQNADLWWAVAPEGGTGTFDQWVSPIGVYDSGVAPFKIRGPTVSAATLAPFAPIILVPSGSVSTSPVTWELQVTDDQTFTTKAIATFQVKDIAGSAYPQLHVAYGGSLILTPPSQQVTITGGSVTIGALGTQIGIFRPGATVLVHLAGFPAEVTTATLYLGYVGSPVRSTVQLSGGSGWGEITIPNNVPMGLNVIIAVAETSTEFYTAAQFIYIAPTIQVSNIFLEGRSGETIAITGYGFPSRKLVDFAFAYNPLTNNLGTGNVAFVFDVPGTVTISREGSFTAQAELKIYDATGTELTAIPDSDLGPLTLFFDPDVTARGLSAPTGYTNPIDTGLDPQVPTGVAEFSGAVLTSKPDRLPNPATLGDESIAIISPTPTVYGNKQVVNATPGSTDIEVSVFNMPAGATFDVYLGNYRVFSGSLSAKGSAKFTFTVPEIPRSEFDPVTLTGGYVLRVVTKTTPPITASQGGGYEWIVSISPSVASFGPAQPVTDKIFWESTSAGAYYIEEGVSLRIKVVGLAPYEIVAVQQVNLATNVATRTEYFQADANGVAIIEVTTAFGGVTGQQVEIRMTGLSGSTIPTLSYYTVGPVTISNVTAVGGSAQAYSTPIYYVTVDPKNPGTFQVTFDGLVPDLRYEVYIDGRKVAEIQSNITPAGSDTATVTVTSAFAYGAYLVSVIDTQTRNERLGDWMALIVSTPAPGVQPAGVAMLTPSEVTAGSSSGVLVAMWNLIANESGLKVGITGVGEAGTTLIISADANGAVVVDVLASVLTEIGATRLEVPAGTYAVYVKRQSPDWPIAVSPIMYVDVVEDFTITKAGSPVPPGSVFSVGKTIGLYAFGLQANGFYFVALSRDPATPGTQLDVVTTGFTQPLQATSGGSLYASATGPQPIEFKLPSYLVPYTYYYLQVIDADTGEVVAAIPIFIIPATGSPWWSSITLNVALGPQAVYPLQMIDVTINSASDIALDFFANVYAGGTLTAPTPSQTEVSYYTVYVKLVTPDGKYNVVEADSIQFLDLRGNDGVIDTMVIQFTVPNQPDLLVDNVIGVEIKIVYSKATTVDVAGGTGAITYATYESEWVPIAGVVLRTGTGALLSIPALVDQVKEQLGITGTLTDFIRQTVQQLQLALETVQRIDANVIAIRTDLGTVLADLSEVKAAVTEVRDNVVEVVVPGLGEIRTDIQTLSELVAQQGEEIKMTVTQQGEQIMAELEMGFTTLQTGQEQILQLLSQVNATVVEVRDGVAVIQTQLGTIQANVEDLQTLITDAADQVLLAIDEQTGYLEMVVKGEGDRVIGEIGGKIDALQPVIADVADGMARVETAIGEAVMAIEELKQANAEVAGLVRDNNRILVAISTNVGTITSTLDALKGLIEENVVGGIEAIQSDLASLAEQNNAIASQVAQVLEAATALQQQVAKIDQIQTAVAGLSDQIAGISDAVQGLQGRLDTLESNLSAKIDGVSSKIDTTSQQLSEKIDQANQQASSAASSSRNLGIVNAVLSLIVLAAAGYIAYLVRQQIAG